MSTKPNFLIIGAPKCGTTTLWHELRKHPDVFMPDKKELNFFSSNFIHYGFETFEDWSQYESYFREAGTRRAVGESSPTYSEVTIYPEVVARVAQFLPGAKLIFIVRHPLRRIVSHWHRNVFMGRLPPDTFNDAVRMYRTLIEPTLYFTCLQAYRRHFPDEQIHLVFLEDLRREPYQFMNQCFTFLGVEPLADQIHTDPAQNTLQQKAQPSRTLKIIQSMPEWLVPRRIIPQSARNAVRAHLTKPLPKPIWDPATKRWAIDQVGDEARNILEYAGKPEDFWGLL